MILCNSLGDEGLEEENESAKVEVKPTQTLNILADMGEQEDSQQFGPYQHNTSKVITYERIDRWTWYDRNKSF